MTTKYILRIFAGALCALLAWTSTATAQIVASGLTGTVTDASGNPLGGATVTLLHVPTNTTVTSTAGTNGRFSFRGLRPGGPYTLSAARDGYTFETIEGVQTALGEDIEVRLAAQPDVEVLERMVVQAEMDALDPNSTGANSVLNAQRIAFQPTTNRSFSDMIKTNPFVTIRSGESLVALGQNNRFNSISVDGARINDQFGLNASGLQSFNNPFPLDALEQFSVSLAPYDVRRSGFTGASVNAVTKSGTNTFSGSAYYYYTDQDLAGKDIIGSGAGTRPISEEKTFGFTLGGPILRDRLFFFAAYEKFERSAAATNPGFTPDAAAMTQINTRLDQIKSAVSKVADTDFGTHGGPAANVTDDEKRLLKLDWNISSDHRMTVRYSDTVGTQPSFGAYNSTSFSGGAPLSGAPSIGRATALSSNFFDVERTEEVWAGQLFSNWTPDFRTEIAYSNTSFVQNSNPRSIFPEVRIYNLSGIDNTGRAITNGVLAFGTENARQGNDLDVQTEIYSGIAEYTWRNWTFSGGVDIEKSDYYNLFRQSSYGIFGYRNLADFLADAPFASFRSVVQEGVPMADISEFKQTGIFGQARLDVSSRLSLTAGLRVDVIDSGIAPAENPTFRQAFGVTNSGTPDGTTNVAPRVSFNYAVDEERNTQIRGGVGVFLGRAPWVFFSNSFGATGVGRFTQARTTTSNPAVPSLVNYLSNEFDPANPIGTVETAGSTSTINLVKPGIKLPTIMRTNFAVDRRLPALDATLTAEFVYTESYSSLFIDNMNLKPTTKGADGRQRFAGAASGNNAIVPAFGNVLRMRNVDEGTSEYFSLSIDRPFKNGWAYNAAYTHGRAFEAQALGSSTASSQWQFNAVFNQNQVEVARSDFEIRHRLQATVAKEFKYWRNLATTVSLYYEGRTGSPYSWVYTSDINSDGFQRNDLVAVPVGINDPRFDFSALSQAQLDTYFGALEATGLSNYAGGYAPRNSFFQPWQNRLDLRLAQEIPITGPAKLELTLDFVNFGSWLSKDLFNYAETLPVPGNSGLVREFGSAEYAADGRIRPTNLTATSGSAIAINNGVSRWRILVGARLSF